MLKILVIADVQDKLVNFDFSNTEVVAKAFPGKNAIEALAKHKPDLVITNCTTAELLNSSLINQQPAVRANIIAKTHQGIQLVPIADIYYFQADDKYVTAYHNQGELLIEDSITSLEKEFANYFIRIHRKTLVAISKIEQLFKHEDGQHYIKLRNLEVKLAVSRRQLPTVRKVLKCL